MKFAGSIFPVSQLWRTLRLVALAECVFRMVGGGLFMFFNYPEAAQHLWFDCALIGGIWILSSRMSTNVLLLCLGAAWMLHFRGLLYLFGWHAGFQVNMLCLTFAVLMFEHLSLLLRIAMALVPFSGLFWVLTRVYDLPPVYILSDGVLLGMYIANTTMFCIIICLIILYFAQGMLERELYAKQQAEMRARLVADLSHELKTPLAAILTRTQVALSRERDPAKDEEVFQLVEKNARGMAKLTRRMLDLSQLESDTYSLEIASVHPVALMNECMDQHRFLCEEKNVRLVIADHDAGSVNTDTDLLRIVLNNLLENAIRHSPAEGTVQLSCGRDAQGCWIRVRDEGNGIDEKHLPHVFESFYRGDAGRKRGKENHGLGLSISRSIMDQVGGDIGVEPTPKGASFVLHLPL